MAPAGHRADAALALACGALTILAFAPFHLAWLPAVTLAVLFARVHHATPAHALRQGFAFALGMFTAGTSWLFIALHTFGGMDSALAFFMVALFTLWLSLFPGAALWLAARTTPAGSVARLVACAAAWPLSEWARSWPVADFPWLSIGYAALTPDGPIALAGFAPIGGTWLVSLAFGAVAACLAAIVDLAGNHARRRMLGAVASLALIIVGGHALAAIAWTAPVGAPLAISLVQGNVAQDIKFERSVREATFAMYIDLVRASRGRVVVLPESALPAFADEIPSEVTDAITDVAKAREGMVLTGLFTVEPPAREGGGLRYYNSVISLGAGESGLYRKRHLVPFGESIPLEPIVGWFIRDVLSIPLANQSRGDARQKAFAIAGQQIAVDICYEDVFGSEIRAQLPEATLLVNVTNDAWYGRSLAALQHNQIAAMRALETGRPMLRATNTGITSAIAHDGREMARLPWFTRDTLEITIDGRRGLTPYARFGDALVVLLAALLFAAAMLASRWAGAEGADGKMTLHQ